MPRNVLVVCWVLAFVSACPAVGGEVTGLTLVDADTGRAIRPLKDGDTIDLSRDGGSLNVRADVSGAVAGVRFSLDGERSYRTEKTAPYALEGDTDGTYHVWTPAAGKHVIVATPLGKGGGRGGKALTVRFLVKGRPGAGGAPASGGGSNPKAPASGAGGAAALPKGVSIPRGAVVFDERNGVIAFEVESARPAGDWRGERTMAGYTGKGYLTWRGSDRMRSPGSGTLTYRILVRTGGTYQLRIRNRHDFHDSTLQNDCWTRMDRGTWVKTFSGRKGQWTWATNHEHGHKSKPRASYKLRPGLHLFEMSGRSKGFSIDRVHLYTGGTRGAEDESLPETRMDTSKPIRAGSAAGGTSGTKATVPAAAGPAPQSVPVTVTPPRIAGEKKVWHALAVDVNGPKTSEDASPNPFTDYELTVVFRHGERKVTVPGYYAADGKAGQTGAAAGSVWRAHFVPDEAGEWTYQIRFRAGHNVAVLPGAAGKGIGPDGQKGTVRIAPCDAPAGSPRARGMLRYVGKRYLQFAGSKEYFLKGGADSPENFLGYADFDQTRDTAGHKRNKQGMFLHKYAPHVRDWKPGDPTWRGGKGKGIIGALNYLAAKGVNSVYFITYNLDGGDGKDVWPWTSPAERFRFDCSKLDQWEIVFSHMDRLGIMLHVLTQETENDQGLDRGELGPQRRLYYRELVARFAHHLMLTWNLGEENTNTDAQRKAFATYLRALDPYDHAIVVHTFPGQWDKVYKPLLGYEHFEGPSIQTNAKVEIIPGLTRDWVERSAKAGRPWTVFIDEPGSAQDGAVPDSKDPHHDRQRRYALWGSLLAGGSGVEWYFGYKHPHNDLNLEDFRSRDKLWDQTRYALTFFQKHLPFPEMHSADELAGDKNVLCFAKPGEVYALYVIGGARPSLALPQGEYTVHWYNPRAGGALKTGQLAKLTGGGKKPLGPPPAEPDKDWVVLVRKAK